MPVKFYVADKNRFLIDTNNVEAYRMIVTSTASCVDWACSDRSHKKHR